MQYVITDPSGKPRKVAIEVETINPDKAQRYLAKNYENNRRLSLERVSAYAGDMKAKEWEFTGQTIVFDANGRLVDGQHRLEAVINSGESVQFLVVKNVSPMAVLFIDKNKSRTLVDTMRIEGNNTLLRFTSTQSMLRMLLRYELGLKMPSESEIKWMYECLQDECAIIHSVFPKTATKPYTSVFRAAFLGAVIAGVSEEEVAAYLEVFKTRTPIPTYNSDAALKWEAFLHKITATPSARLDGLEFYLGSQNSLYYFLSGKRYVKHAEPKNWFPVKDKLIAAAQGRGVRGD